MSVAGPVRFDVVCRVCKERRNGYRTPTWLLVEYHEVAGRTCRGSHRLPDGEPELTNVV